MPQACLLPARPTFDPSKHCDYKGAVTGFKVPAGTSGEARVLFSPHLNDDGELERIFPEKLYCTVFSLTSQK
jgi:hypothetical protein